MKFEVIKQEAHFARWVNWRVELHVFLGLPSIHPVRAVELKEEFLMCVSLETTSEMPDDQVSNQLGTSGVAKSFLRGA